LSEKELFAVQPIEELKVECLSSSLRRLEVLVYSAQGSLLWKIREVPTSRVLYYTKLRAALRLWLEWQSVDGSKIIMKREPSLLRQCYDILRYTGEHLWTIKPKRIFGFKNWEIKNGLGKVVGQLKFENPLIIGSQVGHIQDVRGRTISEIRWPALGVFSSHPKGEILIFSEPDKFRLVSIGASLVRLCTFQQR
jgi:hypothetical protein